MILVTGGSGMVGRNVVRRLVQEGYPVRIFSRSPGAAPPAGVEGVTGDIRDPESLRRAMRGIESIVHLVAILRERSGATFLSVNAQGTRNAVAAAKEAGVRLFVHVGGVRSAPDPRRLYPYSKWLAEEAIRESGLAYTILKPSLLFGDSPGVLDGIAASLEMTRPFAILPNGGRGRFQPLWVEDLTTCILRCLRSEGHVGQTYELGGPEAWTYTRLVELVAGVRSMRPILLSLPYPLLVAGARLLGLVQRDPLVTPVELQQLCIDNTTSPDSVRRAFGFVPAHLEDHVAYLRR
ncbi:MAG: NAD(P)H-binding protein [Chloroflexi bacterium]|nr:NAD(P)H-binding protein [Chloroflexota bacterium]